MVWPLIFAASLSLGWMVSPDVLVRLGSGIAENRTLYLAALGLTTLLSALSISLIRHPALRSDGRCSQTGLLVQGIGRIPAMSLLLTSRVALVLLLPTGLLVTAGFAFNEIFLYWFPNFGFAFLLLGCITLLQLTGERFVKKLQPLFALVALFSLFILAIAGLGGPASSQPISVDVGFTFTPSLLAGALLLFLGTDYITPQYQRDSRLPGLAALFVCLILFLFWAMLSLQYVPEEKLAESTIPHLLVARAILGEPGRVIMGIAIISGTCAAVNALFHLAIGTMAGLASRHLLPGHPAGTLRRRRMVLLFAIFIGSFMAGGLAGYEILETYIEASLLLWLLLFGMQCLAAGRMLRQLDEPRAWQGYVLSALYTFFALYLATVNEQASVIFRFTFMALAATTALSAFWLWKRPAYEVTNQTT